MSAVDDPIPRLYIGIVVKDVSFPLSQQEHILYPMMYL